MNTYNLGDRLPKVIRCLIAAMMFMCMVTCQWMETREVHQFVFMLGAMGIFALILENIWLTLFVLWSIFLYAFFQFQVGYIYILNIMAGTIIYYLVKNYFKREHVEFFINVVLWLCVVNMLYMIVQLLGYEFLFYSPNKSFNTEPMGFMGNRGMVGALFAMAIPLLMTRRSVWFGLILLVPICIARGSINALAAISGVLFILYYRVTRKVFLLILIAMLAFGALYMTRIDKVQTERFDAWKMFMQDAVKHPVTGYGLDSFRSTEGPYKNWKYCVHPEMHGDKLGINQWDNPHNLLISIFYEWGIVGIILLLGYLRWAGLRFKNAMKSNNTIALAGFLVAFFVVSLAYFPMFLARYAILVIPAFALFDTQTSQEPNGQFFET